MVAACRQFLGMTLALCVVGLAADAPDDERLPADPKAWPQIVLTNFAAFRGAGFLQGASSFLLSHEDQLYVATAKHLLGPAGGFDPKVPLVEFDRKLMTWLVHPRTEEKKALSAAGLGIPENADTGHDWLLIKTETRKEIALPAKPLRLAKQSAKVGDVVYLVGVPYDEPDAKQNVYRGKVLQLEQDWIAYELHPPVKLNGFSGAPVVNSDGELVGVMAIWFGRQRDDQGRDLVGGANSIDALRKAMKPEKHP